MTDSAKLDALIAGLEKEAGHDDVEMGFAGSLLREAAAAIVSLRDELAEAQHALRQVHGGAYLADLRAEKAEADLAAAQRRIGEQAADICASSKRITQLEETFDDVMRVVRESALRQAPDDAKDAARYRWLRGNGAIIDRHEHIPARFAHFGLGLDAAIDAAPQTDGEPTEAMIEVSKRI